MYGPDEFDLELERRRQLIARQKARKLASEIYEDTGDDIVIDEDELLDDDDRLSERLADGFQMLEDDAVYDEENDAY